MIPTTIPHGRTARRLEWVFLPPDVRRSIEARCGSPVVSAQSQGAGFTPGFASVLTCEDGSRHFVKAASVKAQRVFAAAYREEARTLAALPPRVPAPRLLWLDETEAWVVLGLEYVESRAPARPWRAEDLREALDAVALTAAVLTPAPGALRLGTFAEELAAWPAYWDHVGATQPDFPHLAEAAALAGRFAEVTGGDTVVHTDLRDDNVLLRPGGTALLCDWNWPVLGAPWLDTVLLLIGPRGDGLDVDAVLAREPLTRDVPPEHVDILLALVAGYFFKAADDPVPHTSPHIREHQLWQGEVTWEWLAERRGWS